MALTIHARRSGRYAVPFAVGLTVLGIAVVPRAASGANPHPTLPPRSAAQLLADVATANVAHLSGTVVLTSRLGLPDLSVLGGAGGATDLTTLLGGSHTAQVSYGGPDRQRVAVLDTLVETEIVRNGRDLWIYTSRDNSTTHHVLPADHDGAGHAMPTPSFSPQQLASSLLADVDPTTTVTVDRTARIAGRAAYQVILSPKQRESLVRSVRISIDAANHVPLRVQVFGASSSPAVELGFVDVSFAAPPASTFTFTPPPGSQVHRGPRRMVVNGPKEIEPGGIPQRTPAFPGGFRSPFAFATRPPVVLGTGWTAVVRVDARSLPPEAVGLLAKAGEHTTYGVVLRTKLLTLLLAPDGRVYAGAVTLAALERAAR